MTPPWQTDRLPELVGAKEAAEILGVDKMTLHRWMRPGSGSFGPLGTRMCEWRQIAAGPVWAREDVERFRDEIGRQRRPAGSRGQ